jgi:hypothetical protein
MPAEERRARWLAMIGKLRSVSALSWFSDFVHALGQAQRVTLRHSARRSLAALSIRSDRAERSLAQTH